MDNLLATIKQRESGKVLTRAEVTIRTSCLHFGDIFLPQSELLVNADNVLPYAERGHTVCVVWHTTEMLCALSSSERLPPGFGATVTSMYYNNSTSVTIFSAGVRCLRAAQSMRSAVPSTKHRSAPQRFNTVEPLRTIGAEEQDLVLAIQIDKPLLNSGALARDQQVNNRLSTSYMPLAKLLYPRVRCR